MVFAEQFFIGRFCFPAKMFLCLSAARYETVCKTMLASQSHCLESGL